MLFKQTEDRRKGSGPDASQWYVPHHFFGTIGGFESGPPTWIRLLALRDDDDLEPNNDGNWTVFWIDTNDLSDGCFEHTHLYEEFV